MRRRQFVSGALTAAALGTGTMVAAHPPKKLPVYNLPPEHLPRLVKTSMGLAPYEIHVIPQEFALYWTLPGNTAMRYVVGIGRPGLYEEGEFYIGAKKEWPSWTPTPGMLRREPEKYSKWADGMPGGLNNPLGSRALYLFQPGRGDTFLRVHGTHDPSTLGLRVSNGCARLVNDQMIDLYDRVPMDTRVVLYPTTA
ncbi:MULTISPECIES: L,D-transpeptidase [unclassified Marinovum]